MRRLLRLYRNRVTNRLAVSSGTWASSVEQRHNQRPHKRSVQCADTHS
ncbi:hypothetical protein pphageT12_23 [Pseudomonas phage pphageT12]|nr:hypothetical protein pphageB21_23 [Pseudomonas phage pphageB21]UAW53715.1 hypothetical protein pphageT21_23 [Pseudomonas phage pphageT21]UAW53774.1 hypothetical protein pphageT12_23 [Pseudomonas phage pphageT12]